MDNPNNEHHHGLDMSPILVGLFGVLAGTLIVAICHCIIVLCNDTQRRTLPTATATANAAPEHPTVQVIVESKYSKEHKQDLCSICLGEFRQQERVRVLPECAHIFHMTCINKWLQHHSNCPLCRATALHLPPLSADLPPLGGVLDMNDDALMEILVRLPAKSLIRFKSVCKKWHSLISSDYLCHRHTLLRPKPQPSFILHVPCSDEFFYFNHGEKTIIPYTLHIKRSSLDLDPNHPHKIVQACNGLLLLVSKRYVDYPPIEGAKWAVNFYDVYNPTTKQSREMSLTRNHEYPIIASMSLAFDPTLSPYYKIVCIRSTRELDYYSNDITFRIEVYDSESHSWKVSVEAVPAVSFFPRSNGVHWNNCIYWHSKKKYCCFDIAKNEITTLPFPHTSDIIGDYCHIPYIQECNGHLYHFEWIWKSFYDRGVIEPADQSIAVWELGGNNEWLFKYYHTLGDDDSEDHIIGLVRSDGDGDEACSLLSYSQAGKMKAYNFINKTCEDIFQFKTHTSSVLDFQFGEVLALV